MGLRADSARPQRVSGSARTDIRRAESARNPIASHVNFGDDSALSAFTRTQWTAAFSLSYTRGRLAATPAPHLYWYRTFQPRPDARTVSRDTRQSPLWHAHNQRAIHPLGAVRSAGPGGGPAGVGVFLGLVSATRAGQVN